MFTKIKNYFLTGVLVTAPVVITFWIVTSLVNVFDRLVTPIIPYYINPNFYLPRDVPGLGLIVLFIFLVFIGFITANFFGSWVLKKTELIIHKIPLIKVFYKAIKQILETLLKGNSKAFREAVLLQSSKTKVKNIDGLTDKSLDQLFQDVQKIIDNEVMVNNEQLSRNDVHVFHGEAVFLNTKEILVVYY